MSSTWEIDSCEVCGGAPLAEVLDIGSHPMCDDLVPIGASRVCAEYPIVILYCGNCGTAHQKHQIPKFELFPESYHYRSRNTGDVLEGMRNLVLSCREHIGELRGKRVLDIGCNDGSLLGFFREQGAITHGIEPTGAAHEASAAGHAVIHDYFSEDVARQFKMRHGCPDVVTFTNVFAHIEDLGAVTRALAVLCGERTSVVIENHYLGSVISRRQFDTFYHEHPRTYSYGSFVRIANGMSLVISRVEFPSRYGGNIRVFLRRPAAGEHPRHHRQDEIASLETDHEAALRRMSEEVGVWRVRKLKEIRTWVERFGPLRAKAFPGRSAILIKLLGLDSGDIRAVFEKPGSPKIGHWVPGTRIPIVSDEGILDGLAPGEPILNLAWHISPEIRRYLRSMGCDAEVIDILSDADFAVAA